MLAGTYSVDVSFDEDCFTSDSIVVEYKLSPTIDAVSDLVLCAMLASPTFDLSDNNTPLILGAQDPNRLSYVSYHNTFDAAENDLDAHNV